MSQRPSRFNVVVPLPKAPNTSCCTGAAHWSAVKKKKKKTCHTGKLIDQNVSEYKAGWWGTNMHEVLSTFPQVKLYVQAPF